MEKTVVLTVEMSEDQAEAYSQFLKRAGLSAYRQLAATDDEAYTMQAAGEKLIKAFADAGYSPR